MTFKELQFLDLALLFDAQSGPAEAATYQGADVLVIPEIGASNESGNMLSSDGRSAEARFWVKASDVPTPAVGDIIVYDTVSYRVIKKLSTAAGRHHVAAVTSESVFG